MNRLVAIAPVALLSTACAVRTPANAFDAGSRDAFPAVTRTIELPSNAEALGAWQLPPESPWSRYEKLTLLTYLSETPVVVELPDVSLLGVVQRADHAAARLGSAGMPPGTMWIVDLRGAASVTFGATLSRGAAVAPVMTFNNWPAENEVVPAEQTLAALVTQAPRPPGAADASATPVFLLDAWRLALCDRHPDPEAFDNRYMLLPTDFPDPGTLKAAGITRVVYVVEDRSASRTEEDDLHDLLMEYQDAGMALSLVDLAALSAAFGSPQAPEEPRWDALLSDWSYTVERRDTIVDDPAFYACARGGFGGFGAAPVGRAYPSTYGGGGARAYSGASPHVSGHGGG